MGDIRIVFDNTIGYGDFNMIDGALDLGHDLETAILISLFTDAAADPEDNMPPGERDDPRGVWFDTYLAFEDPLLTPIPNDRIGSKLWQIFWRQRNQDTLNWARDQAYISLEWLIIDGVAATISTDAQFVGSGGVGITGVITEPSGRKTPFSYVWPQES
jgi:phage gp46-like protein